MKLHRIFQTTAVRLAIRSVLLYALVLGAAFAALWWSTSRYVDAQLEASLEAEALALHAEFAGGGVQRLRDAVAQRQEQGLKAGRLYLLVSPDGSKLAGNLLAWPEEGEVEAEALN
ncbi:MAG: hypothetical protein ACREU7_14975, partial [Burkholderiales bacterium]